MARLIDRSKLIINVEIKIRFWDAIKMRIAGKYLGDFMKKQLEKVSQKHNDDEINIDFVIDD